MDRSEILIRLKRIFKIVVNNAVNLDLFDENSDIVNDLGVNSIGMIYLAIAIQDEFKVDVSGLSTKAFSKVSDVIDYISEGKNNGNQ